MSTENRVVLLLMWLKNYSKYYELKFIFNVSESFISREICHMVPIFTWVYRNTIRFPTHEEQLQKYSHVYEGMMILCSIYAFRVVFDDFEIRVCLCDWFDRLHSSSYTTPTQGAAIFLPRRYC